MKERLLRILQKLANFQARLLLTLVFFLVITPYGLLIRCWKKDLLPGGQWLDVEEAEANLENMRRTF